MYKKYKIIIKINVKKVAGTSKVFRNTRKYLALNIKEIDEGK